MKLKNCKVGQTVKLKEGLNKKNLRAGNDTPYKEWCYEAQIVADALLRGDSVEVEQTIGEVVVVGLSGRTLGLLPKFLKPVEDKLVKENTTGETQTGHTTANEIKPFMLVEVLDDQWANGRCDVGERLVVKRIDQDGHLVCLCSENKIKEQDSKIVYLSPKLVKIINSNTGD